MRTFFKIGWHNLKLDISEMIIPMCVVSAKCILRSFRPITWRKPRLYLFSHFPVLENSPNFAIFFFFVIVKQRLPIPFKVIWPIFFLFYRFFLSVTHLELYLYIFQVSSTFGSTLEFLYVRQCVSEANESIIIKFYSSNVKQDSPKFVLRHSGETGKTAKKWYTIFTSFMELVKHSCTLLELDLFEYKYLLNWISVLYCVYVIS